MPIVLTSHDRHDRDLTVLVLKLDSRPRWFSGLRYCSRVRDRGRLWAITGSQALKDQQLLVSLPFRTKVEELPDTEKQISLVDFNGLDCGLVEHRNHLLSLRDGFTKHFY
jgi:hypothetical protein